MLRIPVSLVCLATVAAAGCQSQPLVWKNPFAKNEPEIVEAEPRATDPQARETRPTHSLALSENESSLETERVAANSAPVSKIEALWTRAEHALDEDRFDDAVTLYREVVAFDPEHAAAHHRLGFIHDQRRDFAAAERHYLTATRLDPTNADYWNDLGVSYRVQERFVESESVFLHLISIAPNHPLALRNLGDLSAAQGRRAEAFDYYRQSGLDAPTAEERVIARSGGRQSAPSDIRTVGNESGLPYQSPSPDWNSTYGLSSEVAPASYERRQPQGFDASPRSTEHFEAGIHVAEPRSTSTPVVYSDTNVMHDPRALERTALESGPGSLFPMSPPTSTAPRRENPFRQDPLARPTTSPIQPAYAENPAPERFGTANPYGRSASGIAIQSPPNDPDPESSPYAIPVSNSYPLASKSAAAPATTPGNYRQFPGETYERTATDDYDAMRLYEAELRQDSYGYPARTDR